MERYFGRKIFTTLYLAMLLTAPVVLLTFSGLAHRQIVFLRSDRDLLHFGVFVAFATISPERNSTGSIASKWVAIAVLAVFLTAALFSRAGYGI